MRELLQAMRSLGTEIVKRLPYPLLLRIFSAYDLRRQTTLARDAAQAAGLPLFESLDVRRLKTSDTVFLLGSGPSINGISQVRWRQIGRCDSIGINFWLVHPFVPRIFFCETIPYEWPSDPRSKRKFEVMIELMRSRGQDYADTTKVMTGAIAVSQRQTLLEAPAAFRRNLHVGVTPGIPARSEAELVTGIRYLQKTGAFAQSVYIPWLLKYAGSAVAMLTLAVRMGYKRIVLCGVDLGQAEYFFHDRQRYPAIADLGFTSQAGVLTTPWLLPTGQVILHLKRMVLDPAGIELYVENPSSVLYPDVPQAPESLFTLA